MFLASCVESSSKYKALQAQLDSLQGNYGTQKNQLDEVFGTLNEVEAGLKSIRETENILTVQQQEGITTPQNNKEQIQSDIAAVQSAIQEYKNKIKQLKNDNRIQSIEFKKRLNAIQKELNEKSEMIDNLSKQLQNKDLQLAEKTKQVESLDQAVSDLKNDITKLNTEGGEMKEKITSQDKQIYSAYYIVGTKDELINVGVLTRGGLFKSSKISYQAEKNAFIKIDYREISTINTNAQKAKVISNHPKGTYSIDNINGEAVLTISNPSDFWEQTKYLVIQVQ
jgi:chromosome segregation ATPase